MRGHNEIPHGHFHKNWQKLLKTWFNQPARKLRRKRVRDRKAAQKAPKPVELIRPMVRCPSVRYNIKVRSGKGFSLQELKACKLNPKFAQTIGIAVDYRRRNRCIESLQINVQRLKEYKCKLILFPFGKKKLDVVTPFKRSLKVNQLKRVRPSLKARAPTQDEINFKAYEYLRHQRASEKLVGKRLKRKKAVEDNAFEIVGKFVKKGKKKSDDADD